MAAFYFKFYPGEYLRDTQCLSTAAQVAYDRIMCEHMRNISITYEQHRFFIKRLSEDEKQELMMVLTDTGEGLCIQWVVDSINKASAYSGSRGKNRLGKTKKKEDNDMKSYDHHMESNSNSNSSIKTKKEPKKEFAPGVKLTTQEDEKLKEEFGVVIVQAAYLFLASYKVEKGYTTKSDNLTIRRWVIDAVKKQPNGQRTTEQGGLFPRQQPGTSEARVEALKKWGHNRSSTPHGEGDQYTGQ